MLKNNFCVTINIIEKISKNMQKVALLLERGRPKLEISRYKTLNLRVTSFEYEKISRLAEKLNISKTDAVIRGINLLERDKLELEYSQ